MPARVLLLLSASLALAQGLLRSGHLALEARQLTPGAVVELRGEWLYKPGYLVAAGERPESGGGERGYVPVEVPQFLNRVRWWLDDSEDFDRSETARLNKLGFDTERAEDGWYRLWFEAPPLPQGRHVFLEFEGVAMRCRTYLNGAVLGEHTGMFSRFGYDLAPRMKAGRNLLAVYVSMERAAALARPMGEAITVNLTAAKVLTLSKGMFGPLAPGFPDRAYDLHGIWQPVRLVTRGAARLEDAWMVAALDGAEVRVEARSLAHPMKGVLRARWIEQDTGRLFATAGPVPIELGSQTATATLALRGVKPRLWTPAEPNLYGLAVTLESATGDVLDRFARDVGFRTFEVRGNQLYLNGKPYWLRGANQLPYGKYPWDPELPCRLIRLLHDGNVRVTRTHATPWNEAWLEAADEIGLGVSIEGIRPWALAGQIGLPPREIFEHWLAENEDVVRRCRNHPSVLLWTVGNEMLLRDARNLDKWRLLSEVVRQTRRLDPTRPVVASSDYTREPRFYESVLQPNGIDDGDLDDLHRYGGWYANSAFAADSRFEAEARRNAGKRPLIGQEMSTGYPDLDSGLPVLRYARDLLVPQAWVGLAANRGADPSVFLEHHRAVTKRLAEQLRFQRHDRTAGFLLFSTECWFAHSYDASRVSPYPVYEAVRQAWSPIGLAFETARRRFFAGEEAATALLVTNDDERQRDLADLEARVSFEDIATGRRLQVATARLPSLAYYRTARVPLQFAVPLPRAPRTPFLLVARLFAAGTEIGRTADPVEVFDRADAPLEAAVATLSLGGELTRFLGEEGVRTEPASPVILVGPEGAVSDWRPRVEAGATAILFSPGEKAARLFPGDVTEFRKVTGEFADWAPAAGTAITSGLQAMDLKWWGRRDDERVFVAGGAHRLQPGGRARELIRFIPAHSYIPPEKKPEQFLTVLFELPLGRGRLWVCELDLERSARVDPAARLFARNLIRAALDPGSTSNLPAAPKPGAP